MKLTTLYATTLLRRLLMLQTVARNLYTLPIGHGMCNFYEILYRNRRAIKRIFALYNIIYYSRHVKTFYQ